MARVARSTDDPLFYRLSYRAITVAPHGAGMARPSACSRRTAPEKKTPG